MALICTTNIFALYITGKKPCSRCEANITVVYRQWESGSLANLRSSTVDRPDHSQTLNLGEVRSRYDLRVEALGLAFPNSLSPSGVKGSTCSNCIPYVTWNYRGIPANSHRGSSCSASSYLQVCLLCQFHTTISLVFLSFTFSSHEWDSEAEE